MLRRGAGPDADGGLPAQAPQLLFGGDAKQPPCSGQLVALQQRRVAFEAAGLTPAEVASCSSRRHAQCQQSQLNALRASARAGVSGYRPHLRAAATSALTAASAAIAQFQRRAAAEAAELAEFEATDAASTSNTAATAAGANGTATTNAASTLDPASDSGFSTQGYSSSATTATASTNTSATTSTSTSASANTFQSTRKAGGAAGVKAGLVTSQALKRAGRPLEALERVLAELREVQSDLEVISRDCDAASKSADDSESQIRQVFAGLAGTLQQQQRQKQKQQQEEDRAQARQVLQVEHARRQAMIRQLEAAIAMRSAVALSIKSLLEEVADLVSILDPFRVAAQLSKLAAAAAGAGSGGGGGGGGGGDVTSAADEPWPGPDSWVGDGDGCHITTSSSNPFSTGSDASVTAIRLQRRRALVLIRALRAQWRDWWEARLSLGPACRDDALLQASVLAAAVVAAGPAGALVAAGAAGAAGAHAGHWARRLDPLEQRCLVCLLSDLQEPAQLQSVLAAQHRLRQAAAAAAAAAAATAIAASTSAAAAAATAPCSAGGTAAARQVVGRMLGDPALVALARLVAGIRLPARRTPHPPPAVLAGLKAAFAARAAAAETRAAAGAAAAETRAAANGKAGGDGAGDGGAAGDDDAGEGEERQPLPADLAADMTRLLLGVHWAAAQAALGTYCDAVTAAGAGGGLPAGGPAAQAAAAAGEEGQQAEAEADGAVAVVMGGAAAPEAESGAGGAGGGAKDGEGEGKGKREGAGAGAGVGEGGGGQEGLVAAVWVAYDAAVTREAAAWKASSAAAQQQLLQRVEVLEATARQQRQAAAAAVAGVTAPSAAAAGAAVAADAVGAVLSKTSACLSELEARAKRLGLLASQATARALALLPRMMRAYCGVGSSSSSSSSRSSSSSSSSGGDVGSTRRSAGSSRWAAGSGGSGAGAGEVSHQQEQQERDAPVDRLCESGAPAAALVLRSCEWPGRRSRETLARALLQADTAQVPTPAFLVEGGEALRQLAAHWVVLDALGTYRRDFISQLLTEGPLHSGSSSSSSSGVGVGGGGADAAVRVGAEYMPAATLACVSHMGLQMMTVSRSGAPGGAASTAATAAAATTGKRCFEARLVPLAASPRSGGSSSRPAPEVRTAATADATAAPVGIDHVWAHLQLQRTGVVVRPARGVPSRDYTAVVLEKLLEKRGVVVALMSDRRGGDDGSGTDSDDGRDVDWLTYGFQVLTQVRSQMRRRGRDCLLAAPGFIDPATAALRLTILPRLRRANQDAMRRLAAAAAADVAPAGGGGAAGAAAAVDAAAAAVVLEGWAAQIQAATAQGLHEMLGLVGSVTEEVSQAAHARVRLDALEASQRRWRQAAQEAEREERRGSRKAKATGKAASAAVASVEVACGFMERDMRQTAAELDEFLPGLCGRQKPERQLWRRVSGAGGGTSGSGSSPSTARAADGVGGGSGGRRVPAGGARERQSDSGDGSDSDNDKEEEDEVEGLPAAGRAGRRPRWSKLVVLLVECDPADPRVLLPPLPPQPQPATGSG
ncbi:hypothetical protein CHLRE_07g341900v5 [Chlamydomonas reinhardtii]|uniref:Uncharacterized protein n=1 Tax=Chlamydomonas reinhardtii TaxID=3055 RepID=A0A2K3DKN6_CHLRE|nr:uncharacterized protein CHLRE_07g341900v5 [Chlamydomonas reinhardtii]PNW81081.1 hypothetical protein CHLRE_07g341900v5 [Chlamydomonas reinhardtii]